MYLYETWEHKRMGLMLLHGSSVSGFLLEPSTPSICVPLENSLIADPPRFLVTINPFPSLFLWLFPLVFEWSDHGSTVFTVFSVRSEEEEKVRNCLFLVMLWVMVQVNLGLSLYHTWEICPPSLAEDAAIVWPDVMMTFLQPRLFLICLCDEPGGHE